MNKPCFYYFKKYFAKDAIELPSTDAIPPEYFGPVCVPITALNKICNSPDGASEIIDDKMLYVGIIVRRKLPERFKEYLRSDGVYYTVGEDMLIPISEV